MIKGKKSTVQTLKVLFWLLGTLYIRQEGLTLKELNELWLANRGLSKGDLLSRQALYKYNRAIHELFSVEIKCDRSNNKYQINNSSDNPLAVANNEMLLSIAIRNLLVTNTDLCECINFNNFNRNKQYLLILLYVIKNQMVVKLSYRDYNDGHKTLFFSPSSLEFKKRAWYVWGSKCAKFKNLPISIALSSIAKLEVKTMKH